MAYSDTDPLLPKTGSTPEVQGSRAPSINEDGIIEESGWNINNNLRSRKRRFGDILALICLMAALVFFVYLVHPSGFNAIWGDNPWHPRTIDERVNNILTQTPLIG